MMVEMVRLEPTHGAHPLSVSRDGATVMIEIGEGDDLLSFSFDGRSVHELMCCQRLIETIRRFTEEARQDAHSASLRRLGERMEGNGS